jgi:hypothetical protein
MKMKITTFLEKYFSSFLYFYRHLRYRIYVAC